MCFDISRHSDDIRPGQESEGVSLRSQQLFKISLQWRHNGRDGVSNHQPHQCLLNRLFGRRSKKTSKLRVTGLLWTGEFPAQMASNAENVSIWWRHHVLLKLCVAAIVLLMYFFQLESLTMNVNFWCFIFSRDYFRKLAQIAVDVRVWMDNYHYTDVIMTMMASQITSLTVVYSTVYSDADQSKHQSSASLGFVWGIHRDR